MKLLHNDPDGVKQLYRALKDSIPNSYDGIGIRQILKREHLSRMLIATTLGKISANPQEHATLNGNDAAGFMTSVWCETIRSIRGSEISPGIHLSTEPNTDQQMAIEAAIRSIAISVTEAYLENAREWVAERNAKA